MGSQKYFQGVFQGKMFKLETSSYEDRNWFSICVAIVNLDECYFESEFKESNWEKS